MGDDRCDGEIRKKRGRFGGLIPRVPTHPRTPAGDAAIRPRPAAVRDKILQRRKLESDRRCRKRGPSEVSGQQRNRAELDAWQRTGARVRLGAEPREVEAVTCGIDARGTEQPEAFAHAKVEL